MIKFKTYKMLDTTDGKLPLDLEFELDEGKLLTLYGNSGAGKTTLLRIIAGLTDVKNGYIEAGGKIWLDSSTKKNVPAKKRSVGMVFQDFALFPNLSVRENIAFAFKKGADKKQLEEMIELMELGQLQNSKPHMLSGGQKQRVALARAIVRKPSILLLDEPLSALDEVMRIILQDYILKIHRAFNLTTILVSHYLPEIYSLSDEVICIEKGRIQKRGKPSDIFEMQKISNEFKQTGEIIDIVPSDIVFVVSILCGSAIFKVIASTDEVKTLRPGNKVSVISKTFNPLLLKME